jgi:hypothetical protein
MPRGPKGEKRPADFIQNAMLVGGIATGEDVEEFDAKSAAAQQNSLGEELVSPRFSTPHIINMRHW